MGSPENGSGNTVRILIGIIAALISAHYISMIGRLDKLEAAMVEIRKENATAALNTAVAAANALSAAVQVLEKRAAP